ncbi:MAG: hypothetical protein QM538_01180 [Methylacidiphilales bacterium]|nr:hypothetical protein [Candidatus Methylacidiphilales bacterium]
MPFYFVIILNLTLCLSSLLLPIVGNYHGISHNEILLELRHYQDENRSDANEILHNCESFDMACSLLADDTQSPQYSTILSKYFYLNDSNYVFVPVNKFTYLVYPRAPPKA